MQCTVNPNRTVNPNPNPAGGGSREELNESAEAWQESQFFHAISTPLKPQFLAILTLFERRFYRWSIFDLLKPFKALLRHFNAISMPFQRLFNAVSTPFQARIQGEVEGVVSSLCRLPGRHVNPERVINLHQQEASDTISDTHLTPDPILI